MKTKIKRQFEIFSTYVKGKIKFDLVAGVTVALIAIPQAMAYATIAGVNPIFGLYTAIIPAIIGSLFGSSNQLVTGPTNATALVTASILIIYADQSDYIEFVFLIAILSGIIRLILGLLGLGTIIRYVSNSVLTGFLSGAGTLIIINQLGNIFGIARHHGENSLVVLMQFFRSLPETNVHVLITGLFTIAVLFIGKKISQRLPNALIAVAITTVFVYFSGWQNYGVSLIGEINALSSVFPSFHIPELPIKNISLYINSAFALSVFSLVEAGSISKAVGLTTGRKENPSKEFIGQGFASMVGGFFQCIPSSGSPSRSAVNLSSGAKTKMAGVFSGIFVLFAIMTIRNLIGYIPIASLSAVVIVSAISLFNREQILLTWRSRIVSRVVLLVTFLSTLLLPLQYAIYIGIILSILIYLVESSRVNITYLTVNKKGEFMEHELNEILRTKPEIAIINVEGALFFGAVSDLEEKLDRVFKTGVKVVILRMRRMKHLASTGISSLKLLASRAEQQGIPLLFCGISEEVETVFNASGLGAKIGLQMTFKATQTLFESTTEAIKKAKEICEFQDKIASQDT